MNTTAHLPLPNVWEYPAKDIIANSMKLEAESKFALHSVLPSDSKLWPKKKAEILSRLAEAVHLKVNHDLPLDVEVTGVIHRNGYRIEKLAYQADCNRYVTACLYIPDGDGPFPAVLNAHGHWQQGHLAERVQKRGHILAQNGFVVLSVDAFGAGERSTEHGKFEYHGGARGIQLNNMGETLIGIQIADNMRGIDLLCSLPYVDASNIGVTGASGGGNQTMYLTAFDERVKAAVSVVSVSSFQAMIMKSNCICETIPGGFNVCEESGLIACIAPRAFAMLSGLYDNSTFDPHYVMHTYQSARKVYEEMDAANQLQYKIFPTPHAYSQDAFSYMLGFFKYHLKNEGIGLPAKLPDVQFMAEDEAMVFPEGQRPPKVTGIPQYCAIKGKEIRKNMPSLSSDQRKESLIKALHMTNPTISACSRGEFENGWEKIVLLKSDGIPIPCLLRPSQTGAWRIMSAVHGKHQLPESTYFTDALNSQDGLLLFDIYASGELGNEYDKPNNWWDYHDITRACLWMGRPMLGNWINDYRLLADWLKATYPVKDLTLFGYRDPAIAALLSICLYNNADKVVLENCVTSFDWSECAIKENALTMVLSVPDILYCGDICDFEAIVGRENISWINPIKPDGTPK